MASGYEQFNYKPIPYHPDDKVWEVEWSEPNHQTGQFKTRSFRSYTKAVEFFNTLAEKPSLMPAMRGFTH